MFGLDEVARIIRTVTEESSSRALAIPFLFLTLTLDVNSSGVRRIVQQFFFSYLRILACAGRITDLARRGPLCRSPRTPQVSPLESSSCFACSCWQCHTWHHRLGYEC